MNKRKIIDLIEFLEWVKAYIGNFKDEDRDIYIDHLDWHIKELNEWIKGEE